MTQDKRYIRNEQVFSLKACTIYHVSLHDFSYQTAAFYPIFDQCIFLYS